MFNKPKPRKRRIVNCLYQQAKEANDAKMHWWKG